MMRKTDLILVLTVLSACLPLLLPAQTPATAPAETAIETVPIPEFDLQLDPPRRLQLENAIARRDYKRAETILVEEAERDPKSIRTARLLEAAGGIFFRDAQYLNSAIAWKKAEAIAPLDERSQFTLAMAYIKLNRRDWARPELEKLAAAQPQKALYLYWLARLDYDAQRYPVAIAGLEKVIALDPKMMRAYDSLGLCYDYLGQFDEAIHSYARAVELNRLQSTPSPWPHLDLAISLVAVNRLAEAEANLRQALGYDPQLAPAHYQLGRVLEMQGGYQAAVESLKQAAALDSAYPEPHYLLGRIYHRLGQAQLAQAEAERYQQLDQAREARSSAKPASPPN
jgi:tetratricopeptide (TPR) repeat protein